MPSFCLEFAPGDFKTPTARLVISEHHRRATGGSFEGLLPPSFVLAPSTVRPLARDLRVLVGWPFPLGFGLDERLLLARRERVCV